MGVLTLYAQTEKYFKDIGDFAETLVILFAMSKITLHNNKLRIK